MPFVSHSHFCYMGYTSSHLFFILQYLYYSSKLANAETISRIVLWDQGQGIINNLSALRTMPLEDWKIYNDQKHEVYQWDLHTLSPVVHQWDRDKKLHAWMHGKKHRAWSNEWQAKLKNTKEEVIAVG